MALTITDLPEACLRVIFSLLPLFDFLRVGQVCVQWRANALEVARSKHSVTILAGNTESLRSSHFQLPFADTLTNDDGSLMVLERNNLTNTLKFKWITLKFVQMLTMKLQNVTKLELIQDNDPSYDVEPVLHLLREWRDNLITFEWICRLKAEGCYYAFPSEMSLQLFDCINQLTSLKHLTLDHECRFDHFEPKMDQVDLPILSQLETFYFYSYDHEDLLRYSLRQYAVDNEQLRAIGYANEQILQTNLFKYYHERFGNEFCHKFTQLIYPDEEYSRVPITVNENLITLITQNFTRLSTLSIAVLGLSLECFTEKLAQLKELIYLEFRLDFSVLPKEDQSTSPVHQLPSIKALYLELYRVESHTDLTLLKIPTIFPNVQVVSVNAPMRRNGCSDCEEIGNTSQQECQRLMVQHLWNECGEKKLKQIYTGREANKILGINLDGQCRGCKAKSGFKDRENRTRMYHY